MKRHTTYFECSILIPAYILLTHRLPVRCQKRSKFGRCVSHDRANRRFDSRRNLHDRHAVCVHNTSRPEWSYCIRNKSWHLLSNNWSTVDWEKCLNEKYAWWRIETDLLGTPNSPRHTSTVHQLHVRINCIVFNVALQPCSSRTGWSQISTSV